MKKDLAVIFGLFLVIAGLLIFGQGFTTASFFKQPTSTTSSQVSKDIVVVSIRTLSVSARVAQKASLRKKGLSSDDSLPLEAGMLFVFENPGRYRIWMKDMKFAIDIVWINEEKKVVDIVSNIPPEPGKNDEELTIYKPSGEALYVLEINAGLTRLHNIQIGDQVSFDL